MASLSAVGTLSAETLERLKRASILSTDALVLRCTTSETRRFVMSVTGVPEAELLRLALACELFRLKRVGAQSFDLLQILGIHSLKEMAQASPDGLFAAINQLPAEVTRGRQLPRIETLRDWVEHAQVLAPRIQV